MIVYNVTLKVDPGVTEPWVEWMKSEHMPELMGTGLFLSCRLCRLLEQDETDGVTFSAQYTCESMEKYNEYTDNYAPQIREKSFARFGNKYVAFRTIMEVLV